MKNIVLIALLFCTSCTMNFNVKNSERQITKIEEKSEKCVVVITPSAVDLTEGEISQLENCIAYTVVYGKKKSRKITCGPYEVISFDNKKDMKKYFNK